jgi:4-oxalocrotonate tautomerase
MNAIETSNTCAELPECPSGLSRRAILMTAAGGTMAAVPALAEPSSGAAFGAPLVELNVPAGVLTLEQKAAMIAGVTDVVVRAVKLPPEQPRKVWVQIFETAEGGFGVGGQVFVPRAR